MPIKESQRETMKKRGREGRAFAEPWMW